MDIIYNKLIHLQSKWNTNPQSDYSRAQYTEKYIQDRVSQELAKLEQETIKQFQETTTAALAKDAKPELSVAATNEKIVKLRQVIEENIKLAKVELDENIVDSRYKVLQCLKNNEGKSLNCWDEVEQFRKSVKEL